METLLISAWVMEFCADSKVLVVQGVREGLPLFVCQGTVVCDPCTPFNITITAKPLKLTFSNTY